MKKIRNLFIILATILMGAVSASAQDVGEMLVSEMVGMFNSPQVKAQLNQGGVADFKAEAQGKVMVLSMRIDDKSVNFDTLSAAEKDELTDGFKGMFLQGMDSNQAAQVVAVLHEAGVKIRVEISDSYGHQLSKTMSF